jgi:hypothetical protein
MKPRAAVVLLSCSLALQSLGVAQQGSGVAVGRSAAADSLTLSNGMPDSPGVVQARLARAVNPTEAVNPQDSSSANSSSSSSSSTSSNSRPSATSSPTTEAAAAQEPTQQETSPSTAAKPQTDVPDMPPMAGEQVGAESSAAKSGAAIIHEPVGTAVAEPLQTTGVAASRPAGAAVAPAEQHRVRTVLIRVGSLVGAGVAIGTTMALSQGSPSRPPGSH